MPRSRQIASARRRRLSKQLLHVLPHVLEYVDSPTVLFSVGAVSAGWKASLPSLKTLSLRSGTATHIGMCRTYQMRIAALQGLLRVYCSPMNRDHLRAVDIATVVDEWGGHDSFIESKLLKDELEPLLQCPLLESISMCVDGAEQVLPQLLRKPTLRFARLSGVGYGDISGDTRLSDDICESIAASRLCTLHLRYASWAGRSLVLPQTLKELVVESFPQDQNFGCGEDEEEIPGQVVVGEARLELLAVSMSCGWGFHDRDESRVGCWNNSLLQSFSVCGCLHRIILPQDAYCVTEPAVAALEVALQIAFLFEQLYSWSLLGVQCQHLKICPTVHHELSGDVVALRFAQLPQPLKKRILEFAHQGPVVERPSVWQSLRGREKTCIINGGSSTARIHTCSEWSHIGFPTLADHCNIASDLHPGNEFVIGRDDLREDLKWQNDRAREYFLAQHEDDSEPSKRQKRRQKDRRRKERAAAAKACKTSEPANATR